MWSYYGSKSKIVKFYPSPKYDLIIEPFAGAAWYSILYRHNNVLLNEKYDVIYDIWKWLIDEADSELILNNINFYLGQDIRNLNLSISHKYLLGFCINSGSSRPCNIVQKWVCQCKSNPNWASTTAFQLRRIAKLLPEIKHWKIKFGDYKDLPNVTATWFIDPPYQTKGKYYKFHDIDYNDLSAWCKSRKGQVIVCENAEADWLDFKPLVKSSGQRHITVEGIWLNEY